MKKSLISILILVLIAGLFSITGRARAAFYTTEQVMNKVLDGDKLRTSGSVEVTLSYSHTAFKRATLSPNNDSGTALDFGAECSKWIFLNLDDTNECYIKFDAPATETDFKVPPGSGIGGDSKITVIHAIATDTCEVQAIGFYN